MKKFHLHFAFYTLMTVFGSPLSAWATVNGDVNGDGYVTAADITAIYDWLLTNDNSHLLHGDVTGDGIITAADITAVYGYLLEGATVDDDGTVATEFQGDGTESDPYIISKPSELRKLANDVNSGMTYRDEFFKITANLRFNKNVLNADGSLNGDGSNFEQWIPIGIDENHTFCGTLDGGMHKISGLYIDGMLLYEQGINASGLFGRLSGTVKNLIINDSYINGRYHNGSIAGEALTVKINDIIYYPMIQNIISYTTIVAKSWTGGIVGYFTLNHKFPDNDQICEISNCLFKGLLISDIGGTAGGIAGRVIITGNNSFAPKLKSNGNIIIRNCVNYGDIIFNSHGGFGIGGLIGSVVNGCYGDDTGGSRFYIRNCANFGNISFTETARSGGLLGQSFGNKDRNWIYISNCVNYGITSNNVNSGAIIASMDDTDAYNNYYLETSCPRAFGYSGNSGTNYSMTAKQMKAQSFLNTLNSNAAALGDGYEQWGFGADGFPTLEYINNY